MTKVNAGRFTAEMEGSFVVFIIGMRINRWLAVHKWAPVASAMGGMLQELYRHPELGFLGHNGSFDLRTITHIQYWRSYEQLEHYARHSHKHLSAWKKFNQSVGSDGTVGVFHETYLIEAGKYESVYVNMPAFGLGKVGEIIPATGKRETSRQRLTQQ